MIISKKYPMSQICYIYDKNLDDLYVFALDYDNRCAVDMTSNKQIDFSAGTEMNFFTMKDLVQEAYGLDKNTCNAIHMLDMLYLIEKSGYAPRGLIFIPLNHKIAFSCSGGTYLDMTRKDCLIREFVDNTEVSIRNIKQLNEDIMNRILTRLPSESEMY